MLQLALITLNYIYEVFSYWIALAFGKDHSDGPQSIDYECLKTRNFQPLKYIFYTISIYNNSLINLFLDQPEVQT